MPDCAICLEQTPGGHTVSIHSSLVCHDCVRQIFEAAIKDEDRYPPKWGTQILKPGDFGRVVSHRTRRRLVEKEKEYLTPPALRIYCNNTTPSYDELSNPFGRRLLPPCGAFVGRLVEEAHESIAAGSSMSSECEKCRTTHCLICGEGHVLGGHQCRKFSPDHADDQAFEGLTKGKDYQTCPSTTCQRKLELADGKRRA